MNQGPEQQSTDLAAEVTRLREAVAGLSARIAALEAAGASTAVGPKAEAPVAHVWVKDEAPASPRIQASEPPAAPAPAEPQVVYEEWWKAEWVERTLGGNWLARIGIIAVIVGAAFFMKLAFDNKWIGETGRVVLGGVVGLGLLGAGEYWRRKYPVFAQALMGGGIGLLYLACFSAFALYELIGFYQALGLLSLVNVAAAALAVRHNARALAVIGILGAFVAPFILRGFAQEGMAMSSGEGQRVLAYLVAVDVGVLALALFRKWRGFLLLALVGSLLCYGLWSGDFGDEASLAVRLGYLTAMFLVFVGATTLFHIVRREAPDWLDRALMSGNAAAYFGIGSVLIWDGYDAWAGAFAFALAAFYALLGGLAWRRGTAGVGLTAGGSALAFFTAALPIQLRDEAWTAVAWAIQGTVLIAVSFRLKVTSMRLAGYLILAIGVISLLVLEARIHQELQPNLANSERLVDSYRPILNVRMMAFVAMIAACYLSAYGVAKGRAQLPAEESETMPQVWLVGVANLLTLWVLSAEVIDQIQKNENARNLVLTGLWAGYAAALLVIGIALRSRFVRMGGLALLGLAIVKLFLFDAFALERGYRVASFLGLGVLLVAGGYVYQRYSRRIKGFLAGE